MPCGSIWRKESGVNYYPLIEVRNRGICSMICGASPLPTSTDHKKENISAIKTEEVPDGGVEVPTEPSVPVGLKMKVYRMNGRPNPKWVQYYDPEGNRYNTL